MDIKISVILPSLNVVDYIACCLESVMNQSLRELEILCIDADSTDGTWDVIKDYAEKDNRLQVIKSDERSYGYQVNLGISQAKGEYIAIVETDDFIDSEMFNCLYHTAREHNLDYIKAEADTFYDLDKKRIQKRFHIQDTDEAIYNKVVSLETSPQLLLMDYYIWRGIYKRDFLTQNHIRCNESPGAAYQDIGFEHLTALYAKRAMYIPDSFYRYRVRRDGRSSENVNGLKYSYAEYQKLLDQFQYPEKLKLDARRFFYVRMMKAVLGESRHVLSLVDYEAEAECFKRYYSYFSELFHEHRKELAQQFFTAFGWEEAEMFLNSPDVYAKCIQTKEKAYREKVDRLIIKSIGRKAVIFGCGAIGQAVFDLLEETTCEISGFCDNNKEVWGKEVKGRQVYDPLKAVSLFRDHLFIVANKTYHKEMSRQLIQMGCSHENVMVYR